MRGRKLGQGVLKNGVFDRSSRIPTESLRETFPADVLYTSGTAASRSKLRLRRGTRPLRRQLCRAPRVAPWCSGP